MIKETLEFALGLLVGIIFIAVIGFVWQGAEYLRKEEDKCYQAGGNLTIANMKFICIERAKIIKY